MILNSLKNFLKCLAYVLVPLGCLLLGVLFGLDAALNTVSGQITYIKEGILNLVPEAVENVDELWSFVLSSVQELNWRKPIETLQLVLQGEWLADKISGFLGLTTEQAAQFVLDIQALMQTVSSVIGRAVKIFLAWIIFSAIVGYFVTNLFVRKTTVKRGLWKFLAVSLLDSLFSVTLIAFTTWILTLWSPGAAITSIISVIVFGFVSLTEAYLIHGRGKVPFTRVVNVKNFFLLQLSSLIVFAIAVILVLLVLLATNILVGIAVAYAVVIIALLVVNVNAESYVVKQVQIAAEQPTEEPPKELPPPTAAEA